MDRVYEPTTNPSTPKFMKLQKTEAPRTKATQPRGRRVTVDGKHGAPLPCPIETTMKTGKSRRRRTTAAPSGHVGNRKRSHQAASKRGASKPSSDPTASGHLLPKRRRKEHGGRSPIGSAVEEAAVAVGAGMGAGRAKARSRAAAERQAGQGKGEQGDTEFHDGLANDRSRASRSVNARETITKAESGSALPCGRGGTPRSRHGASSPLPSPPPEKRRISQERNSTTASSRSSGAVTR